MIMKSKLLAICFLLLSGIFFFGCSNRKEPVNEASDSSTSDTHFGTPRDNTPQILLPEAAGDVVLGNDSIILDVSHTSEGYFMLQYLGSNDKVKLRVIGPNQSEYIYLLSNTNDYETFPLPCGDGSYQVQVLENAGGDQYAIAYSTDFSVEMKNEFGPFLYPNQYVNFTKDSLTVAKGSDLSKDVYSDLEAIENIYNYIINEISYDEEKAAHITSGYLPVIDETLQSKKGICFDYAALMCAMLRTQRIPAKLEIGYSGDAYHAWISAYIDEVGWLENIIWFDGESWTLMDPTLAAGNNSSSVKEYVGDASNYVVKYSY